MRRRLVVGILIFCASFWAFGDALYLTDGTKLEGTIQTETSENITIKTSLVTLTIPQYRIQKIEKDKGGMAEPESTDSEGKTTFEQAEELYHEGKVQAALPLYEKALQEDPNNSDAVFGYCHAGCVRDDFDIIAHFFRFPLNSLTICQGDDICHQ